MSWSGDIEVVASKADVSDVNPPVGCDNFGTERQVADPRLFVALILNAEDNWRRRNCAKSFEQVVKQNAVLCQIKQKPHPPSPVFHCFILPSPSADSRWRVNAAAHVRRRRCCLVQVCCNNLPAAVSLSTIHISDVSKTNIACFLSANPFLQTPMVPLLRAYIAASVKGAVSSYVFGCISFQVQAPDDVRRATG